MSTGHNPSMIGEAKNDMQEYKKMNNLPVYDCEELVNVSDNMKGIKVIEPSLEKLVRAAGHSSVTANVFKFSCSRCLNETRRAIAAKLEAARSLTSIGLLLTQSFQPDIVEKSDTDKIISLAGNVPTFLRVYYRFIALIFLHHGIE